MMIDDLLTRALDLAYEVHRNHVREGSPPLPYIQHPLEVMTLLYQVGECRDPYLLAAAILHDTIEAGLDLEILRSNFGEAITHLVAELTRQEPESTLLLSMPKKEQWNLRSEYLLRDISLMSPEAQVIKLADRISNWNEARVVKSPKKLERYRRQTHQMLKLIPSQRGTLWAYLAALVEFTPA